MSLFASLRYRLAIFAVRWLMVRSWGRRLLWRYGWFWLRTRVRRLVRELASVFEEASLAAARA